MYTKDDSIFDHICNLIVFATFPIHPMHALITRTMGGPLYIFPFTRATWRLHYFFYNTMRRWIKSPRCEWSSARGWMEPLTLLSHTISERVGHVGGQGDCDFKPASIGLHSQNIYMYICAEPFLFFRHHYRWMARPYCG